MAKKKKKPPKDINVLAKSIIDKVTDQPETPFDSEIVQKAIAEGKDPLAVLLGQRGGLKGGKARAEKLSAEERKKIAINAAQIRWSKSKGKSK